MTKLPQNLRAEIRGDALKWLESQAFTTPYEAFLAGVEHGLKLAEEAEKTLEKHSFMLE